MEDNNKKTVILFVDDEKSVLVALGAMAESLGYHYLVAGDSFEAIEVLKSSPVDLVLSDVVMPGMDGLELLDYIKKHHKNTDVIISTGFSVKASYAEVIKAGAIDFIKKPVDRAELEAKLARADRERRLVRELERLSMHDALTSLLNRRSFDERFPYELERAYRQNYSLILAFIDVDNFKDYNDQYGHQAGDGVLIDLGKIMAECTREKVDLCFRLGGDEFIVLLPQASSDQGLEIAQRILLGFSEKSFGETTLSIGLVSCQRDEKLSREEDERLIKERADQAMYDAKHRGKNCIVTHI
ncbi:MAG: diguanylate cyclase [Desulfobulbaceae bacterium]|nr:diguanylate cyclase [Desulfobulbaceae bacterium]